jgi:hypothetical protein
MKERFGLPETRLYFSKFDKFMDVFNKTWPCVLSLEAPPKMKY